MKVDGKLGKGKKNDGAPTRSLLPDGKYVVQVIKSEIKSTKAGDGSYINMTLKVLKGDKAGKMLWKMITLSNPSAQAEEIGQKQIYILNRICGLKRLEDTEQYHGVPMMVEVYTKKSEGYPDKNEIASFVALEGSGKKKKGKKDKKVWE